MRSPTKSGDLNVLRYRQTDRVSSSSAIHFDIAGIVVIKDVWKEYDGWPLNDMERSYKFMVNYGQLWKVAFFSTSPRWIRCSYLAAMANIYAKDVETGLMDYKPDIIISVHPLMQHIPLWVLKWQGLQKKAVFVTIDIAEICAMGYFILRTDLYYLPDHHCVPFYSKIFIASSQIVYVFVSSVFKALSQKIGSLQPFADLSHLPNALSFPFNLLPSMPHLFKESDSDWACVKDSFIANSSSWGAILKLSVTGIGRWVLCSRDCRPSDEFGRCWSKPNRLWWQAQFNGG